jgi:GNAT superfamily N-acetyltransferase
VSPSTQCNEIILRRGVVADAAALAIFAARTFEETFAADNHPEDMSAHLATTYGIAQQSAELTDPSVTTIIAEVNNELIAYAQIRRKQPPVCVTHEAPIELHRFYVDRQAHGTGLAVRLMHAAKCAALEYGSRHMWLGVWEHNPRAIAFYKKSSFIDVGTTFYMLGPDKQTDRVMVSILLPTGTDVT